MSSRAVEVRVGDEALPAHGGARFLEVDAHDDEHDVLDLVRQFGQAVRVDEALPGIVDRARPHDGEEAVPRAVDDLRNPGAVGGDGLRHVRRDGEGFLQVIRGEKGFHRANADIFQGWLHGVSYNRGKWMARSGKIDVSDYACFTGAVEEPDKRGPLGGAGFTTEEEEDTRMRNVLRFGHEVFPITRDDSIAPFGSIGRTVASSARTGRTSRKRTTSCPKTCRE